MTHANNLDDSPPERDEFKTIYSPYRPFPHGAKKALANAADAVEYPEDHSRYAYVSDLPDEETLDSWELSHVKYDSPDETWVTDSGEEVLIYTDRVIVDGRVTQMDPGDAKSQARSQDSFTRTESPA
ncbi:MULTISPECIES: hypothetical protein [Haloferacaceae]|uniref:Halobacterial output domain-containing protein n=2 Tax=Haloferacaceae TaxID=1644056 RepID=A0ABD6DC09_9EURY|nr:MULTISPECIES: hypothetical protein [Halorubraceae]